MTERLNARKVLNLSNESDSRMRTILQILNRVERKEDYSLLMGNKTKKWWRRCCAMIKDADIRCITLDENYKGAMAKGIPEVRERSLYTTEVIGMFEWDKKIAEALNMVSIKIVTEASELIKIKQEI